MKTWMLALLTIGASFLAGWFANGHFNKPVPQVPDIINLAKSETKQIIQDARKGYVPIDSVDKYITSKARVHWAFKDSTIWHDSTMWTEKSDSIKQNNMTPFYESPDTVIQFATKDSIGNSAEIDVSLRQRFFPEYEAFEALMKVQSAKISLYRPPKVPTQWYNHLTFSVGFGGIGNGNMVSLGGFAGIAYSFNLFPKRE